MNREHGVPSFRGRYNWLSNFFPVAHGVYGYPTVEHFFVAMKTTDHQVRAAIKIVSTPVEAKRLGRKINPLRPDWEQIKDEVMITGLRAKFKPGTWLAEKLLETGTETIEEVNTWYDTYWGICNGVGHNNLGIMLMTVREELRNGS